MNDFIYHGVMSAGNNLTDLGGPNNKAACLRNCFHCMRQLYFEASFAQITFGLQNTPADTCNPNVLVNRQDKCW